MKHLIRFEFRKLWNGVSITAVAALGILTVIYALVTLNIQYRTLDSNGNLVTGLGSFRALQEAARDLEGVMDGEYLQKLAADYNASPDKAYLEEHRGFLGTGGMTKYILTNYPVNYAYYGPYMSNGNDKIGLDYEFLSSEEQFYQKFKDAIVEQLLYVNEENGVFPYSDGQIAALREKVQKIRTPFRIAYHTGWAHINSYFGMEYPVFFVLLAFCLASVYAGDSANGIDELALSARHGRDRDMRARWIAGNLFALTVYLVYWGLLIAVHGSIAGLQGLGASAQISWFECIYNINVGTGMLIIFFGGLAGALVMADIVMLLSIMIKNYKLAVVVGILTVRLLDRPTYSQVRLLNPIRFGGNGCVTNFLFAGRTIIPYFVIVLFLGILYAVVLRLVMGRSYRKYCIH